MPHLLPTKYKTSHNGSYIDSSVLTSPHYPTTNLYILMVDLIYFRHLEEEALEINEAANFEKCSLTSSDGNLNHL